MCLLLGSPGVGKTLLLKRLNAGSNRGSFTEVGEAPSTIPTVGTNLGEYCKTKRSVEKKKKKTNLKIDLADFRITQPTQSKKTLKDLKKKPQIKRHLHCNPSPMPPPGNH